MLGRFQSKISKKQQQREEIQQHEERQQQEQQQQDIPNSSHNNNNNNNSNNNNNNNNNNTSNNMPDSYFSSYSNHNNFMPTLSTDEMVSKNKIFSVSPRKKQNKMTQLASLATSFNSNVNINSSNFKNTLNQQNDNKNYYDNTSDKNNDNNNYYANSSNSSFPSTPAVATPTTTLPYFHNVGTRSNSVIAGQPTNSSSLIAPRTTTAQFIEQQQQQNGPSTPIPNDSSATPAFYNHKHQNSVTSFASSIEDNTPIGNFPPLCFTAAFIKLLLETYQLHCQDPTVTPFDENNPPYGVTNIVSKNVLKKAIKKKMNLTINPNPLELGNNANVLAAIRKQLLQEVKKDASLYQSRNNSIISLSNVSVGMGTNTSETWSNPIIANQMPISSFKQPNYNEGNMAPTPLMNNSMARPTNDIYSYNTHPAFQYPSSENQNTIIVNGLNSPCELTSHGNNDLLSPLEPISQQNHHQGYYQQQQQDLGSGAPFMKPSFRSRNNSLLNDLTRTRSNGSPFLYNAPTSGSAGSGLSSGMSSHNIHFNYNNQNGSQQSTPSNTQDYFSSTRNFNAGKREKPNSKAKDSFTFN